MSYIEFEKTDDPEILKMQLEFLKWLEKENKIERKVMTVLFIVTIIGLIICGAIFEFGLLCGVNGGTLCTLLS